MTSSLQTLIRDLGRRRGRERRGLALAEGVRLVEEALAAGAELRGAVISPVLEGTARGKALKAALAAGGVRLEEVAPAELDALADTEHPQGVVAVFAPKAWTFDDVAVRPGAAVLVLDAVQDPGNVGTLLRTAWALGAAGVVALKGTADLANPKAVRGSMGAVFRVPAVATTADDFLRWAGETGVEIWVTAADAPPAGHPPVPKSQRVPVALVVGNEGAGVGAALTAAAARRVGIRLAPGAESLNVAVAAGILLHEVIRDD
jgi:RNA methyltransferase, TrmH family